VRGADWRPSPNHGARRTGPVDILLLHYTAMPSCEGAIDWLCDPESGVSCHYVLHEDGRVVQLVDEGRRAWHAGLSSWKGESDVNSRSIGVEICHPGDEGECPPYPPAQIEALVALCRGVLGRWPIPPERVLAHSDVAPARKRDPGAFFPWARLAAEGVGHWVEPAPIGGGRFMAEGDRGEPVEALQAMLALYGYGLDVTGVFDEATRLVVAAFQRHFRPARVDGVADRSTVTTLYRLLDALGPRAA
jgi:N-acetylmuramoyl-L-alanine amidase